MILYIEDMMYRKIIAKIVFLLSLMLFLSSKSILAQSDFTHNEDSVIRIIILFNSDWNHQVMVEGFLYEFPHGGNAGVIYATIPNRNEDTIKITVRARKNVFYKWHYCNMYIEKSKIQDCVILRGGYIYKPSCFEIIYSNKNFVNTRYRQFFDENYMDYDKYFLSRKIKKLKHK
jgi:hypothetical protein